MKHIMLDLETMGVGNRPAIVAIGACMFDPRGTGVEQDHCFYIPVSLESSAKAGLELTPSTILWWLQQSDAARASTFPKATTPLGDALVGFSQYLARFADDIAVWGNGATFDNVVIRSAYAAVGLPVPWSFRNDKCYRTVVNLPGAEKVKFERSGTAHNALDDAITQALHLQKVYKALSL